VANRFGGLPVPAALTRGMSLRVIDYTEKEMIATAGAGGIATAQYDYLQQGHYWRIERICVLGDSANQCTVFVYQGDQPISQRQRDGTPLPPGIVGVSEYPSFLTILPTSCLTVVVSGANECDVFNVTAQLQVVQKVTG
jgi:hypothetical protein